jgi:hypothetical protein
MVQTCAGFAMAWGILQQQIEGKLMLKFMNQPGMEKRRDEGLFPEESILKLL